MPWPHSCRTRRPISFFTCSARPCNRQFGFSGLLSQEAPCQQSEGDRHYSSWPFALYVYIYIYVYIKFLNFTAHQYRGLLSPPLGFVLRRIFCSSDFTLLGRILGHLLNILLREAPAHFSLLFSSEFFEPLEGPRDGRCHCLFPCTIHAACQLHAASWNERKSTRVLTSEFLAS